MHGYGATKIIFSRDFVIFECMVMVLQRLLYAWSLVVLSSVCNLRITIHEAKYFTVTPASIIIKPKILKHEIIPNSLLKFCHSVQNVHFLDA